MKSTTNQSPSSNNGKEGSLGWEWGEESVSTEKGFLHRRRKRNTFLSRTASFYLDWSFAKRAKERNSFAKFEFLLQRKESVLHQTRTLHQQEVRIRLSAEIGVLLLRMKEMIASANIGLSPSGEEERELFWQVPTPSVEIGIPAEKGEEEDEEETRTFGSNLQNLKPDTQ